MKKHATEWMVSLNLLLGALTACGAATAKEPTGSLKENVVVHASNDFGFELYRSLRQHVGVTENIFISPASISTALSMLYVGAEGKTATEIAQTLRFQGTQADAAKAFGNLARRLQGNNDEKALTMANQVWGQAGLNFGSDFRTVLQSEYETDVKTIDFREVATAMDRINNWVKAATNGKIPTLVDEIFMSPDLQVVLANAMYFKGNWEIAFKKAQTSNQPFYLDEKRLTKIKAPLMNRRGRYRYYETNDLRAISLPFKGKDIYMTVVVPSGDAPFSAAETALSSHLLQDIFKNSVKQEVDLFLPKFKMALSYDLEDTLATMGMQQAFSDGADFSRMLPDANVTISKIIHKTFIEVNEEGAEAAAATGVGAVRTSAPEIMEVRLDRPFIYLIHTKDLEVIFLGRVTNPLAK